jgi:hypothetical protein
MARSQPWPFDDEDRPSGSVRPLSQADLQATLAHFNSDPDKLLAGTGADRPAEAVPVRASVGRPGGSAEAQWQRLRAAEWVARARTLPWRVAATGIGAGGGVLGSLLAPRLGLIVAALVAIVAGWGLRFQPSPDAVAWRRGAAGSDAPPACWVRWSGMAGRSCTTWPCLAAGPTSTTWPSAPVGCS